MNEVEQSLKDVSQLFTFFRTQLINDGLPLSIANELTLDFGKKFIGNAFGGSLLAQIFKPTEKKESS